MLRDILSYYYFVQNAEILYRKTLIPEQSSVLLSIVSMSIIQVFYHSNYLYRSVPDFNVE